jgi:predicted nucleic acid-binding Zn ribbon protein
MPKRPHRNKQTPRPGPALRSIADLMSARLPALAQRALSTPETSEWHVAVIEALGPELANKVNAITLNSGKITVTVESSAWAARLQFALAECETALREKSPEIRDVVVRVRPRGARAAKG